MDIHSAAISRCWLTLAGFARTIRTMAKTVITQVTDDLDGSTGAETISFGYRGMTYEIDLGRKNANAFDKMMKPYLDAARKVTASRTGRRASSKIVGSSHCLAVWLGATRSRADQKRGKSHDWSGSVVCR